MNDQDFADGRLITILHDLFQCNLQENFHRVKVSVLMKGQSVFSPRNLVTWAYSSNGQEGDKSTLIDLS